ncbi:MAG TPA: nucleotidyltransferase family protein [Candidatus Binatia bacterium]|nr:nucleotidyltransferase family protein [Candidatus Binatia bacterium]
MLHAVITAGGRVDGTFAQAIGTDVKALAPLGSRRLIDTVIDAARGIGVAAIAVVGGEEVRAHCGERTERFIDESPDGGENARRALRAFPGRDLIYLTSDIPFLDAEGLRDFTARAEGLVASMPLAAAQDYARAFPGAPEHTMSLAGERFASGTVFVLRAPAVAHIEGLAGTFFDARKSAWRLATLCGPSLLIRYALRRLHIADVEARASGILGGPVRAIRDASPGLCYDIDTLEEWEYARARS